MTDTYRTAVNPYAAMAAEARAKLESDRIAANELEAQREALLAEVNAGLAPFRVIEAVEADVKKRAARRAMLRRAVEPVSLAVVGTVLVSALHYALDGDFEWGRLAFVLTCSLAFNFWYLGTFKRSPP